MIFPLLWSYVREIYSLKPLEFSSFISTISLISPISLISLVFIRPYFSSPFSWFTFSLHRICIALLLPRLAFVLLCLFPAFLYPMLPLLSLIFSLSCLYLPIPALTFPCLCLSLSDLHSILPSIFYALPCLSFAYLSCFPSCVIPALRSNCHD